MGNVIFKFPILGQNKGQSTDEQPGRTSGYLNNVRPYDVLEGRLRGGQRPGLEKMFAEQIGGKVSIVVMTEITVVT